jgi:UDP-GlcNAc:undecaprenyl-phosphate GlcNAc-1-phosphate transferase
VRSHAAVFGHDIIDRLLLVALTVFLVSTGGTRLAMWLSARLRFIDTPGSEAHKQHAAAVPYGGGLAMAAALAVGLVLLPHLEVQMQGESLDHSRLRPVLIGALALLLVGAVDDRRPLPAWLKLLAQGLVSAWVIPAADLAIDSLHHWPPLAFGITWLWVVMITNAFNLLDHADGLSGSVAVVSAAALLGGSLLDHDLVQALLWMVVIPVLLGFLVWNLPPARIYMGDAGSMPLGFLVACGTLAVTFWPSGTSGSSPLAVLSPLIITAIPLFDSAVVLSKRLLGGKPLFQGDRNHISHRLTRLGYSPRVSLAVVVALQIALAGSAFTLRLGDQVSAVVVLAQDAAILLAVVLLETIRDRHV